MLRLAGFFALAVLFAAVLGHLPIVGPLFRSTGIFGVLIAATLLSAFFTRLGGRAVRNRKTRSQVRTLAAVDSAHNHGKIGALYLARGSARRALAHLKRAVEGEPAVAEWHYRLGIARLRTQNGRGALEALERCTELDPEHAYGAALMRQAEALQMLGRYRDALAVLATLERNHGPNPESAFRRGRAHRALGERDEARAAFQEVGSLARQATRYQRGQAGLWSLRARLARFL